MDFTIVRTNGREPLHLGHARLFAIGYAGRNTEKTMEHIRELEREFGVPAPKRVPTIFSLGRYLLTQERDLLFAGRDSCGEVEFVIVVSSGRICIGLGSDHTDRRLEAEDILKAKQVCAKPVGSELWDYAELRDHWDGIRLLSWQTVDGVEIPYQDGTLADILPVETILGELRQRAGCTGDCVVFSGTVPLLDGFRFGSNFRCAMVDEVLGRRLEMDYNITAAEEEL